MVMGDDSCSRGPGFKFLRQILDGHFFTLICCKKLYCLLGKTKNKRKKSLELAHLKKNLTCFWAIAGRRFLEKKINAST